MALSETRTVTTQTARRALRRCFAKQRPVFLWGPPGIGKSELVASITEEMGGLMIDLRLAQMEPTDLRGIPYFNKESSVMDWAPPIDLPNEELASKYPLVVPFLDELNSAPPAVQAAAYQLTLNRRVGKYVLPKNVVLVAAGNRETDKGVTFRMPAPLANRFVHLELRVDHDSWEEWAVLNKIHKDVVGYIGFAKQDLFDFDPKSPSRSFATPRSWTFVSELLDESMADTELMDLVAGTVGEGVASKFMAHRKIAAKLPLPSDILAGKVKTMDTKEISAMYSLTISMCYELKDLDEKIKAGTLEKGALSFEDNCDNFFRFMLDNFTPELTIMGARTALTTYALPIRPGKLKHFKEFHQKFGKYVSVTDDQ